MNEKMTLREFLERYERGDFCAGNRDTQIRAGWFDWFCPDAELPERLAKIYEILRGITNSFVLDNYQVRFANNCPADENPFYDDVSFVPMDECKNDDLRFLLVIDDKRRESVYEISTARNGYRKEAGFDTLEGIWSFINKFDVQEFQGIGERPH